MNKTFLSLTLLLFPIYGIGQQTTEGSSPPTPPVEAAPCACTAQDLSPIIQDLQSLTSLDVIVDNPLLFADDPRHRYKLFFQIEKPIKKEAKYTDTERTAIINGSLLYMCKGSTMELQDFNLDVELFLKAVRFSAFAPILLPQSDQVIDTTRRLTDLFVANDFLPCRRPW